MADITDPFVTRFTNEEMRPLAEVIQMLRIQIEAVSTRYVQQVLPLISANAGADVVVDGRAGQGVTQVTKKNLTDMAQLLSAINTNLSAAGVATLVDRFAVRPARVTRSQ